MKKIVDLYRQYGVSSSRLRDLAVEMEKHGRAEKRRDSNNVWDENSSGKEIWYLDEAVVIEYLNGQLQLANKKTRSQSELEILQSKDIELQKLQLDFQKISRQLEDSKTFARMWKRKAKQLRTLIITSSKTPTHIPDPISQSSLSVLSSNIPTPLISLDTPSCTEKKSEERISTQIGKKFRSALVYPCILWWKGIQKAYFWYYYAYLWDTQISETLANVIMYFLAKFLFPNYCALYLKITECSEYITHHMYRLFHISNIP